MFLTLELAIDLREMLAAYLFTFTLYLYVLMDNGLLCLGFGRFYRAADLHKLVLICCFIFLSSSAFALPSFALTTYSLLLLRSIWAQLVIFFLRLTWFLLSSSRMKTGLIIRMASGGLVGLVQNRFLYELTPFVVPGFFLFSRGV